MNLKQLIMYPTFSLFYRACRGPVANPFAFFDRTLTANFDQRSTMVAKIVRRRGGHLKVFGEHFWPFLGAALFALVVGTLSARPVLACPRSRVSLG